MTLVHNLSFILLTTIEINKDFIDSSYIILCFIFTIGFTIYNCYSITGFFTFWAPKNMVAVWNRFHSWSYITLCCLFYLKPLYNWFPYFWVLGRQKMVAVWIFNSCRLRNFACKKYFSFKVQTSLEKKGFLYFEKLCHL